ncbi:MAG: DUF3373 family protein [Deltaproteobacteria bacterium]|nr:DUF3373 family protein [Deltaproteobacteria bacterium]
MRTWSVLVPGLAVGLISLAPVGAVAEPSSEADELRERLDELEDRFDQVEKRSLLDRIELGGDYRTIFNAVVYKGPTADPYYPDPTNPAVGHQIEETNAEIWSHRLRISMKAEPIRSVRVSARMVMYKIFGDGDAAPFVQDSMTTRLPRDSSARFDQAWIDWFMTDWLAFSAGRIAYADGNPAELKDNSSVRRATWGLQMVDGEYDTINLTFNLSRALDGWYIRGFYASWFNDNDQDPFGGVPFLSSGTENLRIFGGNMDFVIPGIGRNFLQLGYYVAPKFRPFNIPIPDPGYDPASDYTNAPAPLNGSLLFPSALPDSMGSYQNISALLELYDLAGIGLDLFLAGSVGFLKSSDQGIAYQIPNPADPATRIEYPFLYLASTGDKGTTFFVYAGMRYTLPVKALNETKLGFEFNHGSRYHISFAVQQDNLLTKLATRGNAYEAYLIVPFNEHLFLRASYLYIDSKYQTGFFGPDPAAFGSTAPERLQQIHSFSAVLNASL